MMLCRPKKLPGPQLIHAAAEAVRINPANAVRLVPDLPLPPSHIAMLTQKYWGNKGVSLGVTFLSPTPNKAKVLAHMNAWSDSGKANVVFRESSDGQVRIAFAHDGYWSYLGTDILSIPRNEATMNLQGFDQNPPDSEYFRVVRHETGHTLGFPHEHQRKEIVAQIDPQKAYAFFLKWDGWDRQTVDSQVLTSLDDRALMETPPDVTSIMCYDLPGDITKTGQPIPGGMDIDRSDYDFCDKNYPGSGTVSPPTPPSTGVGLTVERDIPAGGITIITSKWGVIHGNLDSPLKAGKHSVS